ELAASIEVKAAAGDLGQLEAGKTKVANVAVRNTGGAELTVNSVSVGGTGYALAAASAPFTVAPGREVNVGLRVTGGAAGAQNGQLTINSNDPARGQLQ